MIKPGDVVPLYRLMVVNEGLIHDGKKTATTTDMIGNTNQVKIKEVEIDGKSYVIITGVIK